MADLYPNGSANTIYSHLRSLSNTIADLGDIVTSLQVSTILPVSTDTNMPSSSPPGSIRRRFLRIISFGRYSSRSADDTEPLVKAHGSNRRHSTLSDLDLQSNDRPTYTAHQSSQSSDSAQTTIIHDVPPGTAPFSIDAFRDQHREHYLSDTEFDTPSQPEAEIETVNSAIGAEEPSWDPTRLRRNKSIMHCNICNRIWEYNQIHCPGCAARTLHHIPGSSDDSYTENDSSSHDPRAIHYRPGSHNPERDAVPTESSWDTHGLESGTAEESWTTTVADTSAAPEVTESPTTCPIDVPSAGKSVHKKHRKIAIQCCCDTHGDSGSSSCTPICISYRWPTAAANTFAGPVPAGLVCKCSRCGRRHICGPLWGPQYVQLMKDEIQRYERGDRGHRATPKKERSWWMRMLRWFCCC